MKKNLTIVTIIISFLALACKKEQPIKPVNSANADAVLAAKGKPPVVKDTVATIAPITTPPTTPTMIIGVNVKEHGAKGDGITDDTQAITNTIIFAKANGFKAVYFPTGTYSVQQVGITTGVIPLLNGVGLQGDGPTLSHIKLSGGRTNPNSLFYQAWWNEPAVSNVVIEGIDFDGNLSNQKYDASYEYCHALSINNGQNIEVKNCKFQAFRGDGVLFGDTFLSSLNLRVTSNVNVHDNEFYNIYREGAMFCATTGGSFYNNYLHGNGFFVGGVDIERHSANETVTNIAVYNNKFDFRDGYGAVERGGPTAHYRRAITMGFFYSGYKNATADGLSGGHKIYSNQIYQGQIDCWGHTNVSITNNTIVNTYENIEGIGWISGDAIHIADASSATKGLTNITVSNNNINSAINGNGILFYGYNGIIANTNTITATKRDAINIYWASGTFDGNIIQNIGSSSYRVSGLVVNGDCSGLVISNNKVTDTNIGTSRGINYAVAMQSVNNAAIAPKVQGNIATNLVGGVVSEFWSQLGYVFLASNVVK